MILKPPFEITSRLTAGVQIGDGTVSLERDGTTADNRDRFRWYIDLPAGEFTGNNLRSGAGGCELIEAFRTLLTFLSACAEGVDYSTRTGRPSENADMFPAEVAQWASENKDDIERIMYELKPGNE